MVAAGKKGRNRKREKEHIRGEVSSEKKRGRLYFSEHHRPQ